MLDTLDTWILCQKHAAGCHKAVTWSFLAYAGSTKSPSLRAQFQKQWFNDNGLAGGLEHSLFFHSVGNNDPNWLSYVSEGLKPPTSGSCHEWWIKPKSSGRKLISCPCQRIKGFFEKPTTLPLVAGFLRKLHRYWCKHANLWYVCKHLLKCVYVIICGVAQIFGLGKEIHTLRLEDHLT